MTLDELNGVLDAVRDAFAYSEFARVEVNADRVFSEKYSHIISAYWGGRFFVSYALDDANPQEIATRMVKALRRQIGRPGDVERFAELRNNYDALYRAMEVGERLMNKKTRKLYEELSEMGWPDPEEYLHMKVEREKEAA